MAAANMWRCAWEVELLTAVEADDVPRVNSAAVQLHSFYDLPVAKANFVDPGELWYQEVVVSAVEGDQTQLRDEISINCSADLAAQAEARGLLD